MEVIASARAVQIDHLSAEIEPGKQFTFQGIAVNIL